MSGELEVLAKQAVKGDGKALSLLCERLESPVYRLCLRMLGDLRDAEDAAQDVLVKVVTNLSGFQGRSALMTWVHQIAVRHVMNLKQSRAEVRSLDEDAFAALLEQGLAWGRDQPPPSPEDRALLSEIRLSCTQGMLLTLSRDERLALVLVDLLGFDAHEAALSCEVTHEAMRQRLSRARLRLGAFLQRQCGVVNEEAPCRCERQVPAKKALGLSVERQPFTALTQGDLPPPDEVGLAAAELRAVRALSGAFQQQGGWGAPERLRARVQGLLPTVVGPSSR